MNTLSRITPRQAAYRDLCTIIAQLSGRSRRAQRSLLETELVRALERAHDFQRRCEQLGAALAAQRDKVLGADIRVAVAEGAARRSVVQMRQEVFAVVERCRAFERDCQEFLAVTAGAAAVGPPPLVKPPEAPIPDDVDEEAVTERVPGVERLLQRADAVRTAVQLRSGTSVQCELRGGEPEAVAPGALGPVALFGPDEVVGYLVRTPVGPRMFVFRTLAVDDRRAASVPGVHPRVRLLVHVRTAGRVRAMARLFQYLAKRTVRPSQLSDGFYVGVSHVLGGRTGQARLRALLHLELSPRAGATSAAPREGGS